MNILPVMSLLFLSLLIILIERISLAGQLKTDRAWFGAFICFGLSSFMMLTGGSWFFIIAGSAIRIFLEWTGLLFLFSVNRESGASTILRFFIFSVFYMLVCSILFLIKDISTVMVFVSIILGSGYFGVLFLFNRGNNEELHGEGKFLISIALLLSGILRLFYPFFMTLTGKSYLWLISGTILHSIMASGIIISLVLKMKQREERFEEGISRLNLIDSLTGLWNRAAFYQEVMRLLHLVVRTHDSLVIMLVGLDKTDQEHGQDKELRKISQVIKGCIRDMDLAARYGAGEFIIALPGAKWEQAQVIANRIYNGISEMKQERFPLTEDITIRIGATSTSNHEGSDLESLLLKAESALSDARRARNDKAVLR